MLYEINIKANNPILLGCVQKIRAAATLAPPRPRTPAALPSWLSLGSISLLAPETREKSESGG